MNTDQIFSFIRVHLCLSVVSVDLKIWRNNEN